MIRPWVIKPASSLPLVKHVVFWMIIWYKLEKEVYQSLSLQQNFGLWRTVYGHVMLM